MKESPKQNLEVVKAYKDWLKEHPNETWKDFRNLITKNRQTI